MWDRLIKFVFGDKKSRIKKQIDIKYRQAIEFQRNGNIRQYSALMSDIEKLENEYESLV